MNQPTTLDPAQLWERKRSLTKELDLVRRMLGDYKVSDPIGCWNGDDVPTVPCPLRGSKIKWAILRSVQHSECDSRTLRNRVHSLLGQRVNISVIAKELVDLNMISRTRLKGTSYRYQRGPKFPMGLIDADSNT